MIELGIVGSKNSGKTTLIEKLVRGLTMKGLRVATVKHSSHRHQFDIPGKDSDRHRKAGAEITIALSENEIALYAKKDEKLLYKLKEILSSEGYDISLVEGDRSSGRPGILLTRNINEPESFNKVNIIASYGPEIEGMHHKHFELDDDSSLIEFILSWYRENVKRLADVS